MGDTLMLGLASTAVGLVNSTISLFKQVNEAAKDSDDLELKKGLSDLYNQIVDLKSHVLDLAQENADLKQKLTQRESLRRDSQSGFYFLGDDPGPLYPFCYEREERLIHLSPVGRAGNRFCLLCKENFGPRGEIVASPGAGT